MAKIKVSSTIAQIQKQFDKVKTQTKVSIDKLPEGKLKDLAFAVAPRIAHDVGTGCAEMRPADEVSTKKLGTAVKAFAADLKKADKTKDDFLTPDEAKKLSGRSKDLLDLNPDGTQIVSTSCYA